METAAVIVAVLLGAVAAFQLALVLGAPWGEHAYGGRAQLDAGRLVGSYRVMSLAAIPILLIAIAIVLSRAGVVEWFAADGWVEIGVWVVFGYLVLNTAGNLASTSRVERFGMGALTIVAAVCTLVVALG